MSRFRKLSHAIWHCQYHIVWAPKYRYRILGGQVGEGSNELYSRIYRASSVRNGRVESAAGSCPFTGDDPIEGIGIRICWYGKRANGALQG